MSDLQQLPLSIQPVISYPREAQVGKTYLMTVDLQPSGDEWPYEEEEYPIYCMLETSPLFSSKPVGEPAVVLHRFGGTYGAAKFLLTAAQEEMEGEIRVTLVNAWGVPVKVLNLTEIRVIQSVTTIPVAIGTYERETTVPQTAASRVSSHLSRNPYIVGPLINEPEKFFGRESLFLFIEDHLRQGVKVILLYGQRRMGKFAALSQIPNFVAEDGFKFVLFDLQNKSQFSLSEILYELAQKISDALDLDIDRVTVPTVAALEADPNIFPSEFLPTVYQALGGKNLVLLLNELDVLHNHNPEAAAHAFIPYLKSLISEQEHLFIIPVIGRQLDDLPNLLTLFRGAPSYEIGLLDEPSTRRLITNPAQGKLEYEEDAINAIIELSAGHPYFTQAICSCLFSRARQQKNWQVSREDVENILYKAIEISEGALAWFWDGLLTSERVVFSAVAEAQKIAIETAQEIPGEPLTLLKNYGVIITQDLAQAVGRLIKQGFLDETGRRVKVELVRCWLVKQHPLRQAIWELEDINLEAQEIYDQAIELSINSNMQSELKLYEEILALNPNHFSSLFKIANIYLDLEDFNKAVEFYERSFKVDPVVNQERFVRSLLGYGQELLLQKELNLAAEQFAKVLDIEPDNSLAQEQLAQVKARVNQTKRSLIGQSVPLKRFVGREMQITTALDQIDNCSNMAIWGISGMGKSSFLEQLALPQVWEQHGQDLSQAVIILFSCKNICPFSAEVFWGEVLNIIIELDSKSALQSEIKALLEKEAETRDYIRLNLVLRKLGQEEKFLVLLVDDYDLALRPHKQYTEADMEAFLYECRNLAYSEQESRYLSMIVTSYKRLNELGPKLTPGQSPWYNHYWFQELKPFTKDEVHQLFDIPITSELWEAIREITGGNPFLLQIAEFLLQRELQTGKTPDDQAFTRDFESTTLQLFQTIWTRCTEVEQTLLMLVALLNLKDRLPQMRFRLNGIDRIFNQRELELNSLEGQGLLARSFELGKSKLGESNLGESVYSLASFFIERWLIQEVWNTDNLSQKDLENLLLCLLSHKQVKQVTVAINLVLQHKDELLSEWLSKLSAIFSSYTSSLG
ncbi:MAG: hypothetical protein F6J86_05315 [Symploca sp. SIO1B1]|nr:hypothetical protein [Symploca sp. SIO1B1]